MGFITNLLTKNETEIPLLFINFNKKKYIEQGKENSCTVNIHPVIKMKDDEILKAKINDIIDYIRDNYDMNKLP